jgi:hypothetical protein
VEIHALGASCRSSFVLDSESGGAGSAASSCPFPTAGMLAPFFLLFLRCSGVPMLDETAHDGANPEDQDAGRAGKRTTRAAAIPTNDEGADWVPLTLAPFFYSRRAYLRSPREWEEHLQQRMRGCNTKFELKLLTASRTIEITLATALGLRSYLDTDVRHGVTVDVIDGRGIYRGSLFAGTLIEFLRDERKWVQTKPDLEAAASEHHDFLRYLLGLLWFDFGKAVEADAARLMARKNSALAPFEHVLWDQWQYFRVDEEPQPQFKPWYGVPFVNHPSSATGPAGEKLYAIHVAPGRRDASTAGAGDGNLEQKCLQWVVKLLREYPDRPPEPLRRLRDQASSLFPGLSKKAFDFSYFRAREITGNRSWSKAGRPPKS